MELGMSGANGPCAAASVRDSGAANATPRHPDTGARCVRETVRPLRTAQMDCVPRVRLFPVLGIIIITRIIIVIIILIIHTLTLTWLIITSMFELEVCTGWHRCTVHDNLSVLSPVCRSLDILCVIFVTVCRCWLLVTDAWCLQWHIKHDMCMTQTQGNTVWVMHMQCWRFQMFYSLDPSQWVMTIILHWNMNLKKYILNKSNFHLMWHNIIILLSHKL